MSRYTNDLPLNKPVDFVQFMMNDYLSKNGFSTAEWKDSPYTVPGIQCWRATSS